MSVRQAQLQISSSEFSEWAAYSALEPFGEERADMRSAIIACVIANSNRGKNQPPFKVSDFMPKFGRKKPQTWQEMKARFKTFAALHNEKIKNG